MSKTEMSKTQLSTIPAASSISLGQGEAQALPEAALAYRLIEQQAKQHPNRPALYFEEQSWTYAQLEQCANIIAHAIVQHFQASAVVAICLPRSMHLVAAIYATQKAARAYLPLDTAGPALRLHSLLEDAQVGLVLTDRAHAALFVNCAARLILVEDLPLHQTRSSWPLPSAPADSALAYVIHTSGSTGKPKAVAVNQRALYNRIDWMQRAFPLQAGDRVAQKTAYTFDVSVWEFFWPLMYGAALVIVPPEMHKDPQFLLDYIEQQEISVLHFVPSMLNMFLEFHSQGRCPSLHTTFCSGEALSWKTVDKFCEQFASTRLINLYGPTEAAIDVTWYDCRVPPAARISSSPPIGRSIQNMQCLVLRADGQAAAVGEEGFLYLTGVGLADGYLYNSVQTAKAFLSNPWHAARPGYARMYSTGDLARWLADGTLEYLGRADDQVKLHGQRIELQEINNALEQDARVVQACTLLHDASLIAFIQLDAQALEQHSQAACLEQIQQQLRLQLPAFMLPAHLFPVAQIPLSAHGKADRKALRAMFAQRHQADLDKPDVAASSTSAPPDATASGSAAQLRQIWAQVLRLPAEKIDEQKSFLAHGGDSLQMLQVLAKCKQAGLPLTLRQFNQTPLLAALAAKLDTELAKRAASADTAASAGLPALPPASVVANATAATAAVAPGPAAAQASSVTPFQQEMLEYLARGDGSQRYILQREASWLADIDGTALRTAAQMLVARHALLHSSYTRNQHSWQRICQAQMASQFSWFEAEATPAQQWATLCQQDWQRPFLLEQQAPIRFLALRLGARETKIAITSHHLILDGQAFQTLFEELRLLYLAQVQGQAHTLPAPASYAEYEAAMAQQDQAAARQYWQTLLEGLPATRFTLSTEQARQNQFASARHSFSLPPGLQQTLKQAGISLSSALNFVFAKVLARYLGQEKLIWGNAITLRPSQVIQGQPSSDQPAPLVGPCIASMPICADLAGGQMEEKAEEKAEQQTLFHFLRQLQEQILESRQHAHLGLSAIAAVSHSGQLFDTLYTFQRQSAPEPATATSADELPVRYADAAISSHFALTLAVNQDADEIALHLSYRQAALQDYQAHDFLNAFASLAAQLAELADTPLAKLDILQTLPESQRHIAASLQGEKGKEGEELPANWLLQQFRQQVARQAQQIALQDTQGQHYTYAELDQASDILAQRLRDCGMPRVVGIALPRSMEMVIAVLAILKCHACVVSLELDFPLSRLRWIAQQMPMQVIIGQVEQQAEMQELAEHWLDIRLALQQPAVTHTFAKPDPLQTSRDAEGADVFCVNYTSGSTGQAKLVLSSQAAHANRLAWLMQQFPARETDVYCFKTRLCFAPALREILEPLLQGSRLLVLPDAANQNMRQFLHYLREFSLTRLFLTPSYLRTLHHTEGLQTLAQLYLLEVSGEAVPQDLLHLLRQALPATRLYNRYGATEAASLVYQDLRQISQQPISQQHISQQPSDTATSQPQTSFCPVGSPIRNTQVIVTDSAGRLLPRGCVGEICLISPSVANGYADAESSRAVFIPQAQPGLRMFKTGDQGMLNEQGQLCYFARLSRMIKRAGFRIEPREIELVLEQHAAVQSAIVVGHEQGGSSKLIAFILPNAQALQDAPIIEQLRQHARKLLAPYMLPNEYLLLNTLPTTESGKIDFVALQTLITQQASPAQTRATPQEEGMLALFQKVLRKPQFAVDDDFFEAGGDSLQAMVLAHDISQAHGKVCDISLIYRYPQVRQLASQFTAPNASPSAAAASAALPHAEIAEIAAESRDGDSASMPILMAGQVQASHYLFVLPPAGGNLGVYQAWSKMLDPNIALYGLPPQAEPQQGIHSLAQRYAQQIAELLPPGRAFSLSGWSLGATLAYAVAVALAERGLASHALLLIDPGFAHPQYDASLSREKLQAILQQQSSAAEDAALAAGQQALLERLLQDTALIRDYAVPSYSGPIVLLKPRDITAQERNYQRHFNGLENWHRGKLSLRLTDGNHMSMMSRHSDRICSIINAEIV